MLALDDKNIRFLSIRYQNASPPLFGSPFSRLCRIVTALDPLRKIFPLLPDVYKAWPRLEEPVRVSHIVLVALLVALALDLARPLAPLDRPQVRRPQHQPQADYQQRRHRLDGDVDGERC